MTGALVILYVPVASCQAACWLTRLVCCTQVVVDAVSASPRDDDGHTAPSTGLQEPQGRDTPGGDTQQSTPRGWDGRASPQSSSDRATTPRSSASATRSLRQRLWGTVYTLKALPPPVFKFADPDEERWRKIVGSSSRRPRAHVLAARWAQSAPVVSTTATDPLATMCRSW